MSNCKNDFQNSENNINVNQISFSYNNRMIFDNYSVIFPANKCSVIMSPSGSGKTTLLYLIAGLLKPDNGTISFSNKSDMLNPRFSMVFQDLRLIENISVVKNIKLINDHLTDSEINDCLISLELFDLKNKKVRSLSGGEKQRVAIARALLAQFEILLLDEPFTGLDDILKSKVMSYIKSRTAQKTVLLVTHDISESDVMGDTIYHI